MKVTTNHVGIPIRHWADPDPNAPSRERHRPFLTVLEVAEVLRCHYSSVYRMLRNGELQAIRVGSDFRISPDELDRLMQKGGKTSPLDR
jgi:excisionase family DNA binding protein